MRFDFEKESESTVYKLLVGLVAPRPIALITSLSQQGVLNAAPFSAYNYLCTDPAIIGVGIAERDVGVLKDTARNIEQSKEFVVNVVNESIAQQMVICASDFPADVSEVDAVKFTTAKSEKVKVPRIAEAPAALECREYQTIHVGEARIILGRVVSVYIDDKFVDPSGPYVKAEDMHAIGRMNGLGNYVKTREAFMTIPRISYAEWKNKKS